MHFHQLIMIEMNMDPLRHSILFFLNINTVYLAIFYHSRTQLYRLQLVHSFHLSNLLIF